MAEKKLYPYKDQQVEGELVPFKTPEGENWTVYELEDGSKLRVRIVLLEVVRLSIYHENGDPVYLFNAQQVVGMTPEPSLKKKVS